MAKHAGKLSEIVNNCYPFSTMLIRKIKGIRRKFLETVVIAWGYLVVKHGGPPTVRDHAVSVLS